MSNENQKRTLRGKVVSDKMDKTVVIELVRTVQHPKYKKTIKRTSRLKAHDELGAKAGQFVKIVETKPYSKEKTWKVLEILS